MATVKGAYSTNTLPRYALVTCFYCNLVFIAWFAFWRIYQPTNICTEISICPQYFIPERRNTADEFWSKVAATFFVAASFAQFIQYMTSDKPYDLKVPIYCSACVTSIAGLSHLILAYDLLPVVMSPFGRVSHLARFGEWIAAVPLLVVMIHSLDIRDDFDHNFLIFSVCMQEISVLSGGIASAITNYRLAVFLIIISFITFSLLFYDLFRAGIRLLEYNAMKKNDPDFSKKKINKEGIFKSFYLTLLCCCCWSYAVAVYTLGMLHLISHEDEFVYQSVGDIVIKLFYVYVLSMGQISVLSEERLINTVRDISSFFGKMKYMTARG